MYITDRTNNTIKVSYHSPAQKDVDLKTLYKKYPNMYFRFYNII